MSMQKFQAQTYKINDILGWHERNELVLDPHFQRRPVWSPRGKSFLIDSIIKGYPLPQLFIRERILTKERKTIREVVDGQQRLRAILEFINGGFTVMPIHNEDYCKLKFTELPEEIQQTILLFPLSVNTLVGANDEDVLGIFSRINAYAVPLNQSEKLNAEYLGVFKQKIEYLSRLNLAYWEKSAILNKSQIARMKELELTAELISSMLEGLQNGKKIIKTMYKKYDDEFPQFSYLQLRFNDTLEICSSITSGSIANMEFSRSPLFYSLFCAVYDCKYGLKSTDEVTQKKLLASSLEDVQQSIYQLNQAIVGEEKFPQYKKFVDASKSSTDKINNRTNRHDVLVNILRPLFV
jgi:hypothetical protein